jgi:hypothetical protein
MECSAIIRVVKPLMSLDRCPSSDRSKRRLSVAEHFRDPVFHPHISRPEAPVANSRQAYTDAAHSESVLGL